MLGNDRAVTTAEASEILREGRRQIVRRVQSGQLTPIGKLPGRSGAYLFDRSDVEALAERVAS